MGCLVGKELYHHLWLFVQCKVHSKLLKLLNFPEWWKETFFCCCFYLFVWYVYLCVMVMAWNCIFCHVEISCWRQEVCNIDIMYSRPFVLGNSIRKISLCIMLFDRSYVTLVALVRLGLDIIVLSFSWSLNELPQFHEEDKNVVTVVGGDLTYHPNSGLQTLS